MRQISKASFHGIARPTVYGDTLYFSAWNDGRGAPRNTFDTNLATTVTRTPSIPEYGRGTEPVPLATADRLEIATNGKTSDLWPLYLSPDRHVWSTFPMKFDRDNFRCVEAKWDPADRNTIVVLADDGNTSSGGQTTLWRTDADCRKFKRIL